MFDTKVSIERTASNFRKELQRLLHFVSYQLIAFSLFE